MGAECTVADTGCGDRDSLIWLICIIGDAAGLALVRATIPMTGVPFERCFAGHEPILVALETGAHWPGRAAHWQGLAMRVANGRQLPLGYHASQKSEALNCKKPARRALFDVRLLTPVQLRTRICSLTSA